MAMGVPRPALGRAAPLPERMTGPMCCPYQTKEADIPFIVYDIKDDGSVHSRYMDIHNRRLSRVVAIAVLRYAGKSLTPRLNRSNPPPFNEMHKEQKDEKKGGVSYHIIRLINTLAPEDLEKAVDILIDDQSQYALGFRKGTRNGVNIAWEQWHRVRGNFQWPSFLPAEELPIKGDHGIYVEIGGVETLNDILRGLWRYPLHRGDTTQLRRAFLRAVVVFCETLRQLSILLEVFDRIEHNMDARALTNQMWKRIRNWDATSEFVLNAAGKLHGYIDPDTFWERYHSEFGYQSFDEMINELSVFNWQDSLLKHYQGENSR